MLRYLFALEVMWTCMLLAVRSSKAIRPIPFEPSRSVLSSELRQIKREMSTLRNDMTALKRVNIELRRELDDIIHTVGNMAPSTSNNDNMDDLNDKVSTIESKIDIIIDQTGIDVEDTNSYDVFIGNMEAQLLGGEMNSTFDPSNIPTPPPDVLNMDEDLLGSALLQLNRQNQELSSQVTQLQQQISIQNDPGSARSVSSANALEDRLNQIERLVAVREFPASGKTASQSGLHGGIGGLAYSGNAPADGATGSQSQTEEDLEGILENVRQGAISFFSVAQTSSIFGINGVAKAIPYNVKFKVVGGTFNSSNGTFICQISGYYFIMFTFRTFDHRFLGITLMKNDENLTAIFSDKHKRSVMQTQSVIAHLAAGDSLWLRLPPNSQFALHGDQYHMNTFSGFLLYKGDAN